MTEPSEPAATSDAVAFNAGTSFLIPSYDAWRRADTTGVKYSPIGWGDPWRKVFPFA